MYMHRQVLEKFACNYLHLRLSSMCIYICVQTYALARTRTRTHVHVYMHTYMHPFLHGYIHAYVRNSFKSIPRNFSVGNYDHPRLSRLLSHSRKLTECTTHNAFMHKSSFTGQVQCLQRKLEAWAALARHSDFIMA